MNQKTTNSAEKNSNGFGQKRFWPQILENEHPVYLKKEQLPKSALVCLNANKLGLASTLQCATMPTSSRQLNFRLGLGGHGSQSGAARPVTCSRTFARRASHCCEQRSKFSIDHRATWCGQHFRLLGVAVAVILQELIASSVPRHAAWLRQHARGQGLGFRARLRTRCSPCQSSHQGGLVTPDDASGRKRQIPEIGTHMRRASRHARNPTLRSRHGHSQRLKLGPCL